MLTPFQPHQQPRTNPEAPRRGFRSHRGRCPSGPPAPIPQLRDDRTHERRHRRRGHPGPHGPFRHGPFPQSRPPVIASPCYSPCPPSSSAWLRSRASSPMTCPPSASALSGAAPLSEELQTRFERLTGVPTVQGYGLTETSPVTNMDFVEPRPSTPRLHRPANRRYR